MRAAPGDTRGILCLSNQTFPCALGRAGIVDSKREGDGGTPVGRFAIRRLFYRPDREPAPATSLETATIDPNLGWCDDPGDPDHYNRPVRLPHSSGHERLWRSDRVYDLIVILGHNDDPPIPGLGSAIFLHLARPDYAPTEGCVALSHPDLQAVLTLVGPESTVDIALS